MKHLEIVQKMVMNHTANGRQRDISMNKSRRELLADRRYLSFTRKFRAQRQHTKSKK